MSLEAFATTERQRRSIRETGIVTIKDLICAAHGGDSQGDVVTVGLDKVFDVCNKRLSHITMRGEDLKTDTHVTIHGRRPETMVTYRCDTLPPLQASCSFTDADLIPPEWYCPLTHEVFVNPMVLSDGYTYEETAIRQWLELKNTSPMTGEALSLSAPLLFPNRALRDWITRLS